MIEKVVSGGQTGVDRAGLDAALDLGIPCGGWCPNGRLAEDGPLDAQYPLRETPLPEYAQRTEWNVRDSDGTLILHRGHLSGGTAFTAELAREQNKPYLTIDLTTCPHTETVQEWAEQNGVRILNIAGPRETGSPGIYREAYEFLHKLLSGGAGLSASE